MKKVLKFKDLGLKVTLKQDPNAESPRDWDNLGTCLFFHGRYDLGDKDLLGIDANDYNGFDEMQAHLESMKGIKIVIPVYMYDHGNITVATTPFNCRWDSGQLGFIYATAKDITENFGGKYATKAKVDRTRVILEAEIKELDTYVRGDVYGFKAKFKGEEADYCGGFFGDIADNGVYDYLDVDRSALTYEMYEQAFNEAEWK